MTLDPSIMPRRGTSLAVPPGRRPPVSGFSSTSFPLRSPRPSKSPKVAKQQLSSLVIEALCVEVAQKNSKKSRGAAAQKKEKRSLFSSSNEQQRRSQSDTPMSQPDATKRSEEASTTKKNCENQINEATSQATSIDAMIDQDDSESSLKQVSFSSTLCQLRHFHPRLPANRPLPQHRNYHSCSSLSYFHEDASSSTDSSDNSDRRRRMAAFALGC